MQKTPPCSEVLDLLKPKREGLNQDQRLLKALDPSSTPVDQRTLRHQVVFAQAYASHLNYYDQHNTQDGNWQRFFSSDPSAALALASIQDVQAYQAKIKQSLAFLNDLQNTNKTTQLKTHLGYLFSIAATLAQQLDQFKISLPNDLAFSSTLTRLIKNQLAPSFKHLLAYYKADSATQLIADTISDLLILGKPSTSFKDLYQTAGLSKDWWLGNVVDWQAYTTSIPPNTGLYGTGSTIFKRINYLATHNLFTSIFDQIIKVYVRFTEEAKQALDLSLTQWNEHEPHYALFLAFLQLFEYAQTETNGLTKRHLDFYYRDILRFKEKPAEPSHAHLLIELAKQVESYEIAANTYFKAGKDSLGKEVIFANERAFVANQAKITALKTIYFHQDNTSAPPRMFASTVANSADGLGAELTTGDQSWHPFFNKTYQNDRLKQIDMPPAELGFALASHYLWLAEGERSIELAIRFATKPLALTRNTKYQAKVNCSLTSTEGWFKTSSSVSLVLKEDTLLVLTISLTGADPSIVPYSQPIHGYQFATQLPILLVTLSQQVINIYPYFELKDLVVESIKITVAANKLKNLALSNDFGPIDASKPFQAFGALPVTNSHLVIGSKEVFQKCLTSLTLNLAWRVPPRTYTDNTAYASLEYLQAGQWQPYSSGATIETSELTELVNPLPETRLLQAQTTKLAYATANIFLYPFSTFDLASSLILIKTNLDAMVIDEPQFAPIEYYQATARQGFVRLNLASDFGQKQYENDLINYIKSITNTNSSDDRQKPNPPVAPVLSTLTLDYIAQQTLVLNSAALSELESRQAQFFHVHPFGVSEQHLALNTLGITLLPSFKVAQAQQSLDSEAEFYLGISGLKAPQSISILFQVAEGTANPLVIKPDKHIHWSYLSNNQWKDFSQDAVNDLTDNLINSGIISFAIPRDANTQNTLLPANLHWLKAAISSHSDAVCRLRLVAAQALQVTFKDQENAQDFSLNNLTANTISKPDQPVAAVKKINQAFAGFGGRGAEQPNAFYTRVSERLRHKDRAITAWDYEHLVLEAFPQIYQVKCLNHTRYEPSADGIGIYNELAVGHVTLITISQQQTTDQQILLKPYTSLGLLKEIESFLSKRQTCFATLHLRNPQFEEVKADFKVRFYPQFDESFYSQQLQIALIRFLSPWAFTSQLKPSFGGEIYKSALINFIEELPYVDYVTDFQLFHLIQNQIQGGDQEVVAGSKAISILVSAPEHKITAIKAIDSNSSLEACQHERATY